MTTKEWFMIIFAWTIFAVYIIGMFWGLMEVVLK